MQTDAGVPLFAPCEGSSVHKVSHARDTLRSSLFHTFLLLPGLKVVKLLSKISSQGPQSPAGAQQLRKPVEASARANAKKHNEPMDVGTFQLEAATRADARFHLQDWDLVSIAPEGVPSTEIKRTILYTPGGGYVSWMKELQAHVACRAAHHLKARVIFVPYQVAPHTTAPRSYPGLVKVFEKVWQDCKLNRNISHELILFGDSAGGGMAAALILGLKELLPFICDDVTRPHLASVAPDQLLLACPALHIPQDDNEPLVKELLKVDPLFTVRRVRDMGESWGIGKSDMQEKYEAEKKAWPKEMQLLLQDSEHRRGGRHPYVSPVWAPELYETLKERRIACVLQAPIHDLIYQGSYLFLQRAEKSGVPVRYIETQRATHVCIALQHLDIPESVDALRYMWEAVEANTADYAIPSLDRA